MVTLMKRSLSHSQKGSLLKEKSNRCTNLTRLCIDFGRHLEHGTAGLIIISFSWGLNEALTSQPYTKCQEILDMLILCVYVDDIIYLSSSEDMLRNFKESMMATFDMTDLGLLRYFLGQEVKQGNGFVFISQKTIC